MGRVRRTLWPLLAVATLVLARPIARAHAEPTAGELEAARQLFTEGQELEKKKEYGPALEKFKKVVSIKSTAIVRYHEGFCAEKIGRWVEALDAYSRAVIDGEGDPKQKGAVEASQKAADALRPRVPKIRLRVSGAAKGKYEVRIDGNKVADALADAPIPVDPGKHVVELSGEGLVTDKQEVTAVEKETKEVVFEAKDATAPKKDEPKKDPPKKDEPKKDEPKKIEPKKPEPKNSDAPSFGLVFGVSVGNLVPFGKVQGDPGVVGTFSRTNDAGDRSMDHIDYFGSGLALEAQVGFRVIPQLAPYLFFQHGFMGASGFSKDKDVAINSSLSTDSFGVGVTFNSSPSGTFGLFADYAFALRGSTWSFDEAPTSGGEVTRKTATLHGWEPLRLKIGAAFKPIPSMTIYAAGVVSLGFYTSLDCKSCTTLDETDKTSIETTAMHGFGGVSIGGLYDLSLGK